ncbi:MAG: gamma-glutamylcyclotransferase [Cyanobacteria bacterium K_DeepCast_35m_m2_023]|nr:gamma-glutamylcyclotransferase [Cyanobacteria bacterium K_DeepCast_35m_m2_023]
MAQIGNGADSGLWDDGLELVFVYGSLKRGQANHRQIVSGVFVGPAQLQGLALYDLGPFPMAIVSDEPTHILHGELYRVSSQLLHALDRFEGAPRLYGRQRRLLTDGRPVWIYVGRPRQVRFVDRLNDGIWPGPGR